MRDLLHSPSMYYVSVIDGPRTGDSIEVKRMGLLAGPFETHQEALDRVDAVRKIAEEVNVWAHFYAFGTCKLKEPINGRYPPGRLNDRLEQSPPLNAQT